jgi:hypothetical protein
MLGSGLRTVCRGDAPGEEAERELIEHSARGDQRARAALNARLRHSFPKRVANRCKPDCFEAPKEEWMVALIVLLLILAIFGGLGFAAHILWIILIAALVLWLVGFLIGGAEAGVGRRRRWYRW